MPRGVPVVFPGCEYNAEQRVWLQAVDVYKRRHGKVTLDARDVLAIAAGLGYRKPIQSQGESDVA